jgi:hypothetical protein
MASSTLQRCNKFFVSFIAEKFTIQFEEDTTIVHFDIPANNPERAKSYYAKHLGWMIERPMRAWNII